MRRKSFKRLFLGRFLIMVASLWGLLCLVLLGISSKCIDESGQGSKFCPNLKNSYTMLIVSLTGFGIDVFIMIIIDLFFNEKGLIEESS